MSTKKMAGCLLALLLAGCGRQAFLNPGGMWMPQQLTEQVETLHALGVKHPEKLANPLAPPLDAVVWMGGCSASFVSPDGLIITNHHCANAALQCNSSPECNLTENGFLARRRNEELPGEIGKKVWGTREIVDVTPCITGGLTQIADPLARHTEQENRIKSIIAENEDLPNGIRCSVKSYFEGEQYFLIKQLELRDVRLVYAPHNGIGWYGGDIDNWHWPRHTGDFTFFRAYVGPDGKPAEYAEDNVPYRPASWLKIAASPLKEGDFVMVAGYPGHTERWNTAGEIQFAFDSQNPKRIEILSQVAGVYETLAETDPALKIKTMPAYRGVMNYLQLLELIQENVANSDLLEQKHRRQTDLLEWIADDPQREEKWGHVLDEIMQINAVHQKEDYRNYLVHCLTRYVSMIDAAHTIVRMAEQQPKPDAQRDPEFQQRNWDRIIHGQQQLQSRYDARIDKEVLTFYLEKICDLPADERIPLLQVITQNEAFKAEDIEPFVRSLFTPALTLEDADRRVDLVSHASLEDLSAADDPMIQLALRLRPLTEDIEEKGKIYDGQMMVLRPQYVKAVKAFADQPLAPDANGTLRVTYGTVKGYRPRPDAEPYEPFTTLSQIPDKNTGQPPFDAPQALLDAVRNSQKEIGYDAALKDVPVNFLSDVDITGGNSGSATLNHRGELVGLVFDGNSESLSSSWLFQPEITRGIHVDIRYVLWVMKHVDRADNLLTELGID